MSSAHSLPHSVRSLRGEFRKALAPTTGVLMFVVFGVVWVSITFSSSFVATQADVAPNVAFMREQVDPACTAEDVSDVCVVSRSMAEGSDFFESGALRAGEIGQSYRTAPGVIRFVSHQWATTIGWVAIGLLAAFHVATEWTTGSVGVSATATGSRMRFFVNKVLSTWLVALSFMLAMSVGLIVLRSSFVSDGLISNADQTGTVQLQPDPEWASWSGAVSHVAISAAVLFGVSVLAVAAAVLIRKPIATALAVVLAVIAMYLTGPSMWSPATAIAGWLDMNEVNGSIVQDHLLWAYPGFEAGLMEPLETIPISLTTLAVLVLTVSAIAAGSFFIINRRPVL